MDDVGRQPDREYLANPVPCNFDGIYAFIDEMQAQCGVKSNLILFPSEPHLQMAIFQKWRVLFKHLESILFGPNSGWKTHDQKASWFMWVQMFFLNRWYKCITSDIIDLEELHENFQTIWQANYAYHITTVLSVELRVEELKMACQLNASECDSCHLKGQTNLGCSRCDSKVKTSVPRTEPTGAPDNPAYLKMSKDFDAWKKKQLAGAKISAKDFFIAEKITAGFPSKYLTVSKADNNVSSAPNADPFRRYVDKQGGLKNLVIGNF
jgi:hypothetical protein